VTEHEPDAELLARLRAADPASSLPSADPDRLAQLLEAAMSDTATRATESRATGTRDRSPLTWLVAAAAVVLIAAAGIFGMTQRDHGSSPVAQGSVTQLGFDPPRGRCQLPNVGVLKQQTVAFQGTLVSVVDGTATFEVTRWYRGGPTDTARISATPGNQQCPAVGAVAAQPGTRIVFDGNFIAGTNVAGAITVGAPVRGFERVKYRLYQAAGDTSGDVEERQVTDLAGGIAQALSHLPAECIEDVRVLLGQFAEFAVADFRHFTLDLGTYPGTALLFLAGLLEQSQFTEKVSGVEIGNDHFSSVIVFDEDGDRALEDEKQGLRAIPGADDVAFCLVATALAVRQQFVEVLDLGGGSQSNHVCIPERLRGLI